MDLRRQVRLLKAVWKDPRTPWHARAVLAATVGYALSPIDLIPDFIPVLGHLDDLIIVPLGLLPGYMLVPREIWQEHRELTATATTEEEEEEEQRERVKGKRKGGANGERQEGGEGRAGPSAEDEVVA